LEKHNSSLLQVSHWLGRFDHLQVIYHLHNKHEDNEFDMQELADQYEKEIDNMMKGNTEKITAVEAERQEQQEHRRQLETALQVSGSK
jgi:urease accessory protein UreE